MEGSFRCAKFGILRMNVGRALLPVSELPGTLARLGFAGHSCPSRVCRALLPVLREKPIGPNLNTLATLFHLVLVGQRHFFFTFGLSMVHQSAELARRYRESGGSMALLVVPGRRHEVVPEYWPKLRLIAFLLKHRVPADR